MGSTASNPVKVVQYRQIYDLDPHYESGCNRNTCANSMHVAPRMPPMHTQIVCIFCSCLRMSLCIMLGLLGC